MGCCKIDRSRRSLNGEIIVLGVSGFYRLLEDVDFASRRHTDNLDRMAESQEEGLSPSERGVA
jgi:hypothetical protein